MDFKTETWWLRYEDLNVEETIIGEGGFGTVLRGTYNGAPVAIKKLFDFSGDVFFEKLVAREISVMKQIQHENIIPFVGICQHEGTLYIVTQLASGGDLRDYVADHKNDMTWEQRINFCIDICKGMIYLHSNNIMHRDIKSDNMLINDEGRVQLCDFGVARVTQQNVSEKQFLTRAGTELFMAPEIMVGQPYNDKADVFSFGVVMYEIMCSRDPLPRKPFPAQYAYSEEQIKTIKRNANEKVPQAFLDLLLRCVAKNPDQRPTFAEALAIFEQMLEEVQAGTAKLVPRRRKHRKKPPAAAKPATVSDAPSMPAKLPVPPKKPKLHLAEVQPADPPSQRSDENNSRQAPSRPPPSRPPPAAPGQQVAHESGEQQQAKPDKSASSESKKLTGYDELGANNAGRGKVKDQLNQLLSSPKQPENEREAKSATEHVAAAPHSKEDETPHVASETSPLLSSKETGHGITPNSSVSTHSSRRSSHSHPTTETAAEVANFQCCTII